MDTRLRLRPFLFSCTILFFCGLMTACGTSSTCAINTATLPLNATANHNVAPSGNQAQFALKSSVVGNFCPATPDFIGVWSTSDSVNTAISNQAGTQGLATCLSATPTPATISNSSSVRGKTFPSAKLVCQ